MARRMLTDAAHTHTAFIRRVAMSSAERHDELGAGVPLHFSAMKSSRPLSLAVTGLSSSGALVATGTFLNGLSVGLATVP